MDEKYIQDLYNWIASQDASYMDRYSIDQFKQNMINRDYATKMHQWINGIDPTFSERRPIEKFYQLVGVSGVSPMSPTAVPSVEQQQEELKKKAQPIGVYQPETGTTESSSGVPFLASPSKRRSALLFPEELYSKTPVSTTPKFIEEQLGSINVENITSKEEEAVVPQLTYQFGPLGFKFEEADMRGDAMNVTAPNGNTIKIDLDKYTYRDESGNLKERQLNPFAYGSPDEATKLKQFLNDNMPQLKGADLQRMEQEYTGPNKKIISESQQKDLIKSISAKQNSLVAEYKQFENRQTQLQTEKMALETVPFDQRINPQYQQRLAALQKNTQELETLRLPLVNKINALETQSSGLEKAIGSYVAMRGEQGTWYDAAWNEALNGVGSWISSSRNDVMNRVSGFYNWVEKKVMTDEQWLNTHKEDLIEAAKLKKIKQPNATDYVEESVETSPGVFNKTGKKTYRIGTNDMSKWWNSLNQNTKDDLQAIALDKSVKGFLYEKDAEGVSASDLLRAAPGKLLGASGTTPEYMKNLSEGSFLGKAVMGVAGSIPSFIGGSSTSRVIRMMAQSEDAAYKEMEKNPNFENITESEKRLVALPIAITGAALEEIGFRNLIGGKGLLNSITLKVLGKAGATTTAKSFSDLVKNEVEGMLAKGTLTLVGGALAEAETGATQQAAEYVIKDIYNLIKDKRSQDGRYMKMFDTPNSISEWAGDILEAGALEAVGGIILGMPNAVGAAYSKKGFLNMSDDEFKRFESMANDATVQSAFIADLKTKMNMGRMTTAEAKEKLNDYRNAVGVYRSIPQGLSTQAKKEAMNLIKERNDLNNQIEGKDEALTTKQRDRINEINNQLNKLTEDAVQESSAAQGVQGEAGPELGLQQMGQGDAQPEVVTQGTEVLTEEETNRKKELEDALTQPENDKGTVTIGSQLVTREDAQNELDEINKKVVSSRTQEQQVAELQSLFSGQEQQQPEAAQPEAAQPEAAQPSMPQPDLETTIAEIAQANPDLTVAFENDQVIDESGNQTTVTGEMKVSGNESAIVSKYNEIMANFENATQAQKNFVSGINEMMKGHQANKMLESLGGTAISNQESINNLLGKLNNIQKGVVKSAQTMVNTLMSVFPNMNIYFHENEDDYNKVMESVKGVAGSAGNFASVSLGNGKYAGRIDINLSKANKTTVAHEIAHAILLKAFGDNQQLFESFRTKISTVLKELTNSEKLRANALIDALNASDADTVRVQGKVMSREDAQAELDRLQVSIDGLNQFASQYGENVTHEEFLTQLTALLSANRLMLTNTIANKIARIINQIVSALTGGLVKPFSDKASVAEVIYFFNSMAATIGEGGEIEMGEIEKMTPKLKAGGLSSRSQLSTDGTNIKLTGNESLTKGENAPTVTTNVGYKDDYSLSEILNENHAPNSRAVSLAFNISSGKITYTKDGEKVTFSLPYVNIPAAKKIKSLREKYKAVQGSSKEAKASKEKIKTQINKVAKSVISEFTDVMTQNLLALYDTLTDKFIENSKKWYEGANRMANSIATQYNISLEQAAGIIGVLSPQNDWFNNVSVAERTIEVMSKYGDTKITNDIVRRAVEYNTDKKTGEPNKFALLLMDVFAKYGEVSINELQASNQSIDTQAILLRGIDQAMHSPKVAVTNPTGAFVGFDKIPVRWNSSTEIGKAITIYRNNDVNLINDELGNGNKVRNFYNNIVDPNSATPYVTADTHALSAALNGPISANDAGGFGLFNGSTEPLYALVKGAYINAAKIAGVKPREMQSITWEAQRIGINDKNRTENQKAEVFKYLSESRTNNKTPYERATELIARNRSASPEWGKQSGIETQKSSDEIRKGNELRAQQRISAISDLRGQPEGSVGAADTGVGGTTTGGKAVSEEVVTKAQKVGKPGETLTFTVNTKEDEKSRRIEEQKRIDSGADLGDKQISEVLATIAERSSVERGVDKRDVRRTERLRGNDVNVIAEYSLDNEVNNGIKEAFPLFQGVQKVYEITDGDVYRKLMIESLQGNRFAASVTVHTPEEFNGMRMFVTEDGSTGITLTKEGFLGGAFSSSERPNNLAQLMVLGIKEGATTAECFDTVLPDYYANFGFKAVSRTAFNDEFKPMISNGNAIKDWDYATYRKYNEGRPDVVFMIYDGGDRNTIEDRIGQYEMYKTYEKQNTKLYSKDDYDGAYRRMEEQAVKRFNFEQEQALELPKVTSKSSLAGDSKITDFIKKARAQGYSEDAIRTVLANNGIATTKIDELMQKQKGAAVKTEITEQLLPGFDELVNNIKGIMQRLRRRGADKARTLESVMNYVQKSKVYEDATDVQREMLVRQIRKQFGLKEKSAPLAKRILTSIKDIKKITMTEKDLLIKQINDIARGAKDAITAFKTMTDSLTEDMRDMAGKGKITMKQAAAVLRRFSKVDMFNEESVRKFVDYMSKVFANAEYADTIAKANRLVKNARKNIRTKIGAAESVFPAISRLFSISPDMIPMEHLADYMNLLEQFGEKAQVLTLSDVNGVVATANDILNTIDEEMSLADELAERFDLYQDKVLDANGKIKFADTVKKMLSEGQITEKEAELMNKYKTTVFPREAKAEMTEQELQDEKDALIKSVYNSTVDSDRLGSREERSVAINLRQLLKLSYLNKLTNDQLKNILKVIDNINNGYLAHSAQLAVERLTSIKNEEILTESIDKAKPLAISKIYARIKSLFTKKGAIEEMVRRNPLFFIDQIFGDFKTKGIFNAIFASISSAQSRYETDMNKINKRIEAARNKVAKSFKSNPNLVTMSSYKMMTYLVQLEFLSNPDSNQVNSAASYLKETIKFLDKQGKEKEADMLQKILDDFSDSNGEIDNDALFNSFNKAEINAIKEIRDINESLTEKAIHTSAVIRGEKINPLVNYVHLPVMTSYDPNSTQSASATATAYNNSMMPSTKAKSLIERTGTVSPINFDAFASVERGSKFTLMDYHLTEPIRTARKTLAQTEKTLEDRGRIPKQKRQIFNAIKNSFEEATEDLLTNNFVSNSFGDEVVNEISKQGYRAILASSTRFISELTSNVANAMFFAPAEFMAGVKLRKHVMGDDAISIMNNVGSKQTMRLFHGNTLGGRFIDTSILSQRSGVKGAKPKGAVVNRVEQIYNLTAKKYKNVIEIMADTLISSPDKMVSRPIWFGSFATEFKKLTGQDVDFDAIAQNREGYMQIYEDDIAKATEIADEKSVLTSATDNAFMGILKGKQKVNQSTMLKMFNNFNNFMTKFAIYEYTAARTGIMAAVGNGTLTRRQGVALLAGVTSRMVIYSMLTSVLGNGLVGLFVDDDDEEDEKSFLQKFSQSLISATTSLFFGRDFGNATRTIVNYGLEEGNKNFLDFLREGEYDPYKDAIQYSIIPKEKPGQKTNLTDFITAMSGSMSPMLKTADLLIQKAFEDKKKEVGAVQRQEDTMFKRIPLEILGNLGFIPLYKDVRKIVLADIYSSIGKENREAEVEKQEKQQKEQAVIESETETLNKLLETETDPEVIDAINRKLESFNMTEEEKKEKNKQDKERKQELLGEYENMEDMKRYDPELYDNNFGPGSEWYEDHKDERILDKILNREEKKEKDEENDYDETTVNDELSEILGESPTERAYREEEDKIKKKELLGKYESMSDMKRYDPRLYEITFGERSEWYRNHIQEEKIKKEIRERKRKEKDKEFNYKNSDGSIKRKPSMYKMKVSRSSYNRGFR